MFRPLGLPQLDLADLAEEGPRAETSCCCFYVTESICSKKDIIVMDRIEVKCNLSLYSETCPFPTIDNDMIMGKKTHTSVEFDMACYQCTVFTSLYIQFRANTHFPCTAFHRNQCSSLHTNVLWVSAYVGEFMIYV